MMGTVMMITLYLQDALHGHCTEQPTGALDVRLTYRNISLCSRGFYTRSNVSIPGVLVLRVFLHVPVGS